MPDRSAPPSIFGAFLSVILASYVVTVPVGHFQIGMILVFLTFMALAFNSAAMIPSILSRILLYIIIGLLGVVASYWFTNEVLSSIPTGVDRPRDALLWALPYSLWAWIIVLFATDIIDYFRYAASRQRPPAGPQA